MIIDFFKLISLMNSLFNITLPAHGTKDKFRTHESKRNTPCLFIE